MADPVINPMNNLVQGRGPRPFPELAGLVDIAQRVKQGVLDKTQNINQFNNEIKERIRALDALSVGILEKIRELCRKALDCNARIDAKTQEIAEITARLAQLTQEQADSAQRIQQLTDELAQARRDSAESGPLRDEINNLKAQMAIQTSEIELLTRGINDANGVINEAVTELNKPHDTAELQTLLGQLENHINEANVQGDCANGAGAGPGPGPGPGPGLGRSLSSSAISPSLPRPDNPRMASKSNDPGNDNGRLLPRPRDPASLASRRRIDPSSQTLSQPTRAWVDPGAGRSFHTADLKSGRGGKRKTKKGGYKYSPTRKTKIVSSSSRRPKSSARKKGGKRRTRGIKALIV